MVRAAALIGMLSLAACDGPRLSNAQRDQVHGIANDVAASRVSQIPSYSDLSERVEKLEGRIRTLEIQAESTDKINDMLAKGVDKLDDQSRETVQKYNRHLDTMHR